MSEKVKVLVKHSFYITEEWDKQYATKKHIEFYYNDGTSCANNIFKKILKYYKEARKENWSCLCHVQESEVVTIN